MFYTFFFVFLAVKRRKRRLSGLTDQSSDVPSHGKLEMVCKCWIVC